jgi:hypothetical protein
MKCNEVECACEQFIKSRGEYIRSLQEPLIEKTMKGGWFSKPKSREQALKILKYELWSDFNLCEIQGGYEFETVQDLLNLVQLPGAPKMIKVSSASATILKNYFV